MTATQLDQNGTLRTAGGQAGAGQYAERDRRDASIPELTDVWPLTPNEDQVRRAQIEAGRRLELYPNVVEDYVTLSARLAYRLAMQEACYLAFKAGVPHDDDAAFEAVWHGDGPGQTEARVTTMIGYLRDRRAAVEAGVEAPSAVLGPFGDQTVEAALADADKHIRILEEALTCEGRNLSVNQIIVTKTKVEAEEASVPF